MCRIYWDANVLISYITGTPTRIGVLNALLRSASVDNDIEIVTSTLSITEVAFSEDERRVHRLRPNVEAQIDQLWDDRSAIKLVEMSQLVGHASNKPGMLWRPAERDRAPANAALIAG